MIVSVFMVTYKLDSMELVMHTVVFFLKSDGVYFLSTRRKENRSIPIRYYNSVY